MGHLHHDLSSCVSVRADEVEEKEEDGEEQDNADQGHECVDKEGCKQVAHSESCVAWSVQKSEVNCRHHGAIRNQ